MKLSEEIKKEIDDLVVQENAKWLDIILHMRSLREIKNLQNPNEDLLRISHQLDSIMSKCSEGQRYFASRYLLVAFSEFMTREKATPNNEKFSMLFSDLNEMFRQNYKAIPVSIIRTIVESYNFSAEEKDELIVRCISEIFKKEEDELKSRGGW